MFMPIIDVHRCILNHMYCSTMLHICTYSIYVSHLCIIWVLHISVLIYQVVTHHHIIIIRYILKLEVPLNHQLYFRNFHYKPSGYWGGPSPFMEASIWTYSLAIAQSAIEHDSFSSLIYLSWMVISHVYVYKCLP